jgi:hypothetical protein
MRIQLALTAAVLAQVALSVPPASAEGQITTKERVAVLVDRGLEGHYGIALQAADGTEQDIVTATADSDVAELSASADGSHLVYRQSFYAVDDQGIRGSKEHTEIRVSDAQGNDIVVVDSQLASDPSSAKQVDLSPTGDQVVFTEATKVDEDVTTTALRTVPSTGGTATTIDGSDGMSGAHFLDATTLIAPVNGMVRTLDIAGGDSKPVTGLPNADIVDSDFTVSPDGKRVAWMRRTSPAGDTPLIREVWIAGLAVDQTVATFSNLVDLGGSGADARSPSFDHSGQVIRYVAWYDSDYYESNDVYTVPVDSSAFPTRIETAPGAEMAVATLYAANPAPPALAATPTALNVGKAATVTVTGLPGKHVQLLGYSRPSTTFAVVREGDLDETGTAVFTVAPRTNTKLMATTDGGSSAPVVISVRPAESLKGKVTGKTGHFSGQLVPGHGGVTVRVFAVKSGKLTLLGTATTGSSGAWTYDRAFTSHGPVTFIAQTLSDLTNLSGQSNRITLTFP